jgi:carbonic anhydrase
MEFNMIKTCGGLCNLDRRALGNIPGGGAGGLLLLRAAQAATVTALAITCIDYRLVDDAVKFFGGQKLTGDYDQVSLAGASLAAVSDKFPSSNAAFWDHIGIAKQLHHIRRVMVVDHRDCGAYRVAFGKGYKGDRAGETAQHKQVMEQVKAHLATAHPDLTAEFYLMDLDAKTERVV